MFDIIFLNTLALLEKSQLRKCDKCPSQSLCYSAHSGFVIDSPRIFTKIVTLTMISQNYSRSTHIDFTKYEAYALFICYM